ncbi:MAG: hypothetical protein HUU49_00525 [Candidatus Buchananbacteria bacterium]|nr:hypothetical protein [Candidatus Buchananbacteria bacterium]
MIRRKQKIDESEVLKFGFLGGIAQATYILLVALFIQVISLARPAGKGGVGDVILVLIMFVFSAAASAIIVFGYPAYLAVQKRFAESLMTAVTTLVTLAIIGILMFILLSIVQFL